MRFKEFDFKLDRDFIDRLSKNKRASLRIANLYARIGDVKHSQSVMTCCDQPKISDQGRFWRTFFCKDKWCPICQWKKSRYVFHVVRSVVSRMQKDFNFIFVTLTVPNVAGKDLSDTLNRMNKALHSMMKKGSYFHRSFLGCMRATEVTYNPTEDTYHPHFHLLVCVPKDYFSPDKDLYVSQEELLKRWCKYYGDDTICAVSIEGIKKSTGNDSSDLDKACAEVSKYPFKTADLSKYVNQCVIDEDKTVEVFKIIQEAFFRRPLFKFWGEMKKVAAEVNAEDKDSLSFIQFGAEDPIRFHAFDLYGSVFYARRYSYINSYLVYLPTGDYRSGIDPGYYRLFNDIEFYNLDFRKSLSNSN